MLCVGFSLCGRDEGDALCKRAKNQHGLSRLQVADLRRPFNAQALQMQHLLLRLRLRSLMDAYLVPCLTRRICDPPKGSWDL